LRACRSVLAVSAIGPVDTVNAVGPVRTRCTRRAGLPGWACRSSRPHIALRTLRTSRARLTLRTLRARITPKLLRVLDTRLPKLFNLSTHILDRRNRFICALSLLLYLLGLLLLLSPHVEHGPADTTDPADQERDNRDDYPHPR